MPTRICTCMHASHATHIHAYVGSHIPGHAVPRVPIYTYVRVGTDTGMGGGLPRCPQESIWGVLRLRLGLGGVNPRTRCWRVPGGPLNASWVFAAFQGLSAWPSVWSRSHAYRCVDAYVDGRRFTGMPLGTRRRPVGTFRGEVGGFILPEGLRSPEGP